MAIGNNPINEKIVRDALTRAASTLDMDKNKQETFVALVNEAFSDGVKYVANNVGETHQSRGLNKNWRPATGWVVLATIITKVFIEPTLNANGINFQIPMETFYSIASLGGVAVVSRTVEKVKK